MRFAQLQHDVGLGLGTLLLVAGIGGDLINVDDESGHGLLFCWWHKEKMAEERRKFCGQINVVTCRRNREEFDNGESQNLAVLDGQGLSVSPREVIYLRLGIGFGWCDCSIYAG